ncbi:MAG TPA: DUF1684 domain-containing protein [Bacteroidales bacterium]|nr:DUF1684 domain-containing protein [Bacteroidales bacterium]
MNIWLEVTSLIIPGINDDLKEIRDMANFVAVELGADVPWHISSFFSAYKMKEVPATPLKTLRAAKETGIEAGLNYVYTGNTANTGDMCAYGENYACPYIDPGNWLDVPVRAGEKNYIIGK